MKHYHSLDALKAAFQKIKVINQTNNKIATPNLKQKEKCKLFTDFATGTEPLEWSTLLFYCQSSFINLLEAGFLLNEKEDYGYTFILDFNKGQAKYYKKNNKQGNDIQELQIATIEEIMEYDDMPAKTYTEIVTGMQHHFNIFYIKYETIQTEVGKLTNILNDAKSQCAANIEEKVQTLLEEQKFEEKMLHQNRRVFYHRLLALDLIEEETNK